MDEYCIREKAAIGLDKKYYRPYNLQNGSSSPKIEKIRGIIDIAESSDDRFSYRSTDWSPAQSDEENDEAPDFDIFQSLQTQQNLIKSDIDKITYDLIVLNQTEENSYFILNVKLLCAGLQTIPFYKRMDYSAGIFNKIDIKRMNQEAEIADKNYAVNYDAENETAVDDRSENIPSNETVNGNESLSPVPVVENENKDGPSEIKEPARSDDAVATNT